MVRVQENDRLQAIGVDHNDICIGLTLDYDCYDTYEQSSDG
jgi:hypothetical protein